MESKIPAMIPDAANELPKRIWIMWLQGLEQAPELVKACHRSWITLNPGWEVVLLDEINLHEYVDLDPILAAQPHLEKAGLSDVIRIKLLARYGGVWVDATCYCQAPLDDWLDDYMDSGFFAFSKPKDNLLLAVWFLASSPGNCLIKKWEEATDAYLLENPQLARRSKTARFFKWFHTNTHTTRYWFAYPIKKVFKIYPYYWFMYLFTSLVHRDPQILQLWEQTEKFEADGPLRLYTSGLLSPLTEHLKAEIDSRRVPVYKLTWKSWQQLKDGESSRVPTYKSSQEVEAKQYDQSILDYLLYRDISRTDSFEYGQRFEGLSLRQPERRPERRSESQGSDRLLS
jgi:hypothetical protein